MDSIYYTVFNKKRNFAKLSPLLSMSPSIHPRGVHLSCASLLVQAGAALDKQASDGSTAIHLASAMGGVSLVEFALLNHADPDVRDFEGRLPLHWATLTQQSSKCAALLLKVGYIQKQQRWRQS